MKIAMIILLIATAAPLTGCRTPAGRHYDRVDRRYDRRDYRYDRRYDRRDWYY